MSSTRAGPPALTQASPVRGPRRCDPHRRCAAAWGALAGLLMVSASPSASPSLDPVEVMRRVQRQSAAPDEQVQFTMRLVDESGKVRERTGALYEREVMPGAPDEMRLIRFFSPADIRSSGVLTIEHPDRENDQWLYLPAYHTTRRVAPSNRGDRYMGTDFLYEDIMREKIEEYRYRMTGEEAIGGVACHVIEATPQAPRLAAETAYSRKLLWIDAARDLILRADYYDREGRLFKRLTVTESETVEGKQRGRSVRMEDFVRHHATTVEYHDRRIGAGVPEHYFTEQYLKRGQ